MTKPSWPGSRTTSIRNCGHLPASMLSPPTEATTVSSLGQLIRHLGEGGWPRRHPQLNRSTAAAVEVVRQVLSLLQEL